MHFNFKGSVRAHFFLFSELEEAKLDCGARYFQPFEGQRAT